MSYTIFVQLWTFYIFECWINIYLPPHWFSVTERCSLSLNGTVRSNSIPSKSYSLPSSTSVGIRTWSVMKDAWNANAWYYRCRQDFYFSKSVGIFSFLLVYVSVCNVWIAIQFSSYIKFKCIPPHIISSSSSSSILRRRLKWLWVDEAVEYSLGYTKLPN